MLLTDNEYMKLHKVLIIVSDIIAGGYKGDKDFAKKANEMIQNTDISLELVKKVAARLELIKR
ncbi:hypothetical protein SAMN05421825_0021 [Epilithonimonas hungarica]|uniref:Uncharacterized protein n=1 Tax=Epilithonimonas hungarica TaxID=454006 RepID=A0A1G7F995_9FLAO|nr:hypothetical protein SAMN05421825_0021 [Epilithonimonas hungarica]